MRKSIALLTLFISCFGCACTKTINYNSPSTIKDIIKSVVRIGISYTAEDKLTLSAEKKYYVATGFSIAADAEKTYILTNQHVCDMRSKAVYTLTLSSGKQKRAEFVKVDPFADLCILVTKQYIPPLVLAKSNGAQGDRVLVVGGPDGVFPIVTEGVISGYYNIHMKNNPEEDGKFEVHFRAQVMSTPIYGGNSGSPVINLDKEVVGIVFAARTNKEHISYIVPVSEIRRLLDTSEYVQEN